MLTERPRSTASQVRNSSAGIGSASVVATRRPGLGADVARSWRRPRSTDRRRHQRSQRSVSSSPMTVLASVMTPGARRRPAASASGTCEDRHVPPPRDRGPRRGTGVRSVARKTWVVASVMPAELWNTVSSSRRPAARPHLLGQLAPGRRPRAARRRTSRMPAGISISSASSAGRYWRTSTTDGVALGVEAGPARRRPRPASARRRGRTWCRRAPRTWPTTTRQMWPWWTSRSPRGRKPRLAAVTPPARWPAPRRSARRRPLEGDVGVATLGAAPAPPR